VSDKPRFIERTLLGIPHRGFYRRKFIFGIFPSVFIFGLFYLTLTHGTINSTGNYGKILWVVAAFVVANTLLYPYAAFLFHRLGEFLREKCSWRRFRQATTYKGMDVIIYSPGYILIELFLNIIGFMIKYFLIQSIIWGYAVFIAPFGLFYLYYINRPRKFPL
jgi:hypothetical protein